MHSGVSHRPRPAQTDESELQVEACTCKSITFWQSGAVTLFYQFNFDIPKLSDVRHDMRAWERNIHQPLCVEILWNNKSDEETASHSEHTLVESWRIMYSPSRQPIDATTAITNLRQIYKEFTILLRSLYCIVRALPAHQVCTCLHIFFALV